VAAAAIVALMFGLSLSIATAQEGLVSRLRARAPDVKRWGGYVLVAVGLWSLVLAIFAHAFARIFPV
jgi:protein-S-isoprenylcysteine O-methyltransferase Ste14